MPSFALHSTMSHTEWYGVLLVLTKIILSLVGNETLQNLERYLKENFPSQKFHVACRVVKSTEAKVELLVPSNLEKHYGYKIVSDMGFEV